MFHCQNLEINPFLITFLQKTKLFANVLLKKIILRTITKQNLNQKPIYYEKNRIIVIIKR
jgi:hypothetical protein